MPYQPTRNFGGPPPMTLAGIGPRLRAFVIDMVTISIVPGVVGGVLLLLGALTCSQQYDEFGFRSEGCGTGSSFLSTLGWVVMVAGWFAVAGFLWVRPVAAGTSTIGQRRQRVQVVDAATGEAAIGTARAWGRLLLRTLLSPLICGLGFAWAIWDGRHQAWHDKIIDTVVIASD